jgi:DNA-binding transcriptional ArsR family regulator
MDLAPLLMDRVRLAILSTLAGEQEPMDFNSMLERLDVSRGNFFTHARKLEDAGLISIDKSFIERKSVTIYCIAKKVKGELTAYLEKIEDVFIKTRN